MTAFRENLEGLQSDKGAGSKNMRSFLAELPEKGNDLLEELQKQAELEKDLRLSELKLEAVTMTASGDTEFHEKEIKVRYESLA